MPMGGSKVIFEPLRLHIGRFAVSSRDLYLRGRHPPLSSAVQT